MNRSESRVLCMEIIYQIFLYQKNNVPFNEEDIFNEKNITDSFIKNIVLGVIDKKNELFDIANKYLNDWKINRLSIPDQAILALGIYEIIYTDTPGPVVINEAVELSKRYSDDKVKNIINGVLDKVYNNKKDVNQN